MSSTCRGLAAVLTTCVTTVAVLGFGTGAVDASLASPGAGTISSSTVNPLAGRPWAAYEGDGDETWQAYETASPADQPLLATIALQPRVRWYGDWLPTSAVRENVAKQIAVAQNGNPETLVPIADFKMKPWEGDACHALPSPAQQADYKAWQRELAAGIGDAHVSVIMQPDGPFALCAPHHSKIYSHLIRYGVKTLAALPNTAVYIDAGASDWSRDDPADALKILIPAGVKYARGFALNGTHYASTPDQIGFGTKVAKALARKGLTNKHFVVNTAGNGRPFNGFDYRGKDFNNARTCKTATQKQCVTLGIPPTADVANPAWGLSANRAHQSLKYCDGYQWIGRPWLKEQASPFVLKRALDLARTTPYQ